MNEHSVEINTDKAFWYESIYIMYLPFNGLSKTSNISCNPGLKTIHIVSQMSHTRWDRRSRIKPGITPNIRPLSKFKQVIKRTRLAFILSSIRHYHINGPQMCWVCIDGIPSLLYHLTTDMDLICPWTFMESTFKR